uniref:guanylate cyclase n=1 Tax=Haemonchus contortus TaxID=6289 RepID=W6NC84_HAECO
MPFRGITSLFGDLLWTAPEILRKDESAGSQEADIYSFGIICAQLVTKTSAWDIDNRKEDASEILYMVKKGGHNQERPSLTLKDGDEANPALLHLIRDCWTERPSERPDINMVKSNLKSMNTNRKGNLMDYVFNMLEQYASTLEGEVEDRTKQLAEEQKKSDLLLYRMLPKQVADKLKLGQSVEPETFESVTVFFSDVVSFTTLAAKCNPMQVVSLLNDLYTIFDGIIDAHDVYKGKGVMETYWLLGRTGEVRRPSITPLKSPVKEQIQQITIGEAIPSEGIYEDYKKNGSKVQAEDD